ncbi:MAG: YceI family protein [Nitrosomonadales bacterium]|nr:YceI family protein [Nitrosomonadales bacterium]
MSMLLAGMLAACAPGIPPQIPAEITHAPAGFPEAHYLHAKALGKKILHVDSAQSLVVIEVHRAGTLARLGHDHVVASHNVSGYVSAEEGLADFYVPLEQLAVDEPGLRTDAGFDTQPSPEAIEGTRNNMLINTLDSEHFPYALIHATWADASHRTLNVSITLHGMTRTYEVPAQTETVRDGIVVDGKMSFNQTDFGITPLSVLGGAIQVQDKLDLRFHIVAQGN